MDVLTEPLHCCIDGKLRSCIRWQMICRPWVPRPHFILRVAARVECRTGTTHKSWDATICKNRENVTPHGHEREKSGEHGKDMPVTPLPTSQISLVPDVNQHAPEWALFRICAQLLLDRGACAVLALVEGQGTNKHDVVLGSRADQALKKLFCILAPSVGHHEVDDFGRPLVYHQSVANSLAGCPWLHVLRHQVVEVVLSVPGRIFAQIGQQLQAL
mmetsp:Transcript_1562/g.3793  ORF Transcript_1562/g.3793 Transcript_1562/m.3793 type:complete len:216 (-) Transcript_1562:304-951(-)